MSGNPRKEAEATGKGLGTTRVITKGNGTSRVNDITKWC